MTTTGPSITLTASYDIYAAHQLYRPDWDESKNRATFGHCADLHGHQYKLEVTLEGKIPRETGMIINGYEVDRIVRECVMSQIDHKFLNKDIPFFQETLPTAEWIAVWAFNELKNAFPTGCRLTKVRIYETPNLYAEFAGKIRNILFDWSGTLFNDFEISHLSTLATLKHFGGPYISIHDYKEHFVLPAWKFYRRYLKNADMDAVTHFYFEHFIHHIEKGKLFSKAKNNLETAKKMGMRLFICSTVRQDLLEKMVHHLKIAHLFNGVFGSVRDKERTLPAICRRLELKKEETLYAGDMEHDVAAAKKAGVLSAAFLCGYQTAHHLLEATPDFVWNDHGSFGKFLDRIPPPSRGGGRGAGDLEPTLSLALSPQGRGKLPISTVGALIFNKGDIFLVQTHKWSHTFGIPGGKIKKGETMEEALRREILEETGLKLKNIRWAIVQDSINSKEFYKPKQHFLLLNYFAESVSRKFKLNDEAESGFWVRPQTALKLRLNQPTRILLEQSHFR